MEEPVVLIVKAPNQQIDDQTIRCEVSWTVKRLKGHLSEVYPSKPRSEDQKLIYAGQLLTDNVTLKEVLRPTFEGQENHMLHLVCSPTKESLRAAAAQARKPKPAQASVPPPAAPPSEGVRRRAAGGVTAGQSAAAQSPMAPPPYAHPPHPSYSTAQQMAWMQQAYAHYMAQYMQLMATGQMPMGMQMPMQMPMPPSPGGAGPAGGPQPHPHTGAPPDPAPAPADAPQPDVDAGIEGEEGGAGAGGRDWLDWGYLLSRTMVLLSIVYFYSSPFRFFIVSTFGIIMYLYHMGFFRAVQRLDQQEEGVAPVPPPVAPDNNNAPADAPTNAPPPPPAPPAHPSLVAFTWATLSSFFLSLIPEQPNVI